VTIEPGTKLQHYELVEKIGEGGMGEVWLARDVRLERDVAVKVLPADYASNEQFKARFAREGKTISALNHPHICTLHDIGKEGEVHFLVMERLEGEPLSKRIQERGALPLDDALELGSQVASALAAAHRAGIVHRDLKPDNVFLTRSGAKLLDFGLAKTATEAPSPLDGLSTAPTMEKPLTQEGTILGTFQYMAPEQLEGIEADARTDIFALGALLYEMATGRRAFEGGTKTSLIAAIVTSQPPLISSVQTMTPPAFDHLVRKCLEKDPEDRWQSAGDVAGQLRFILTEGSAAHTIPTDGTGGIEAPTPGKRTFVPWALAALLAVVTLIFAVMLLGRTAPDRRVVRASLSPPRDSALVPYDMLGASLSPDGRRLAFAANNTTGGTRIWIRDLATMTAEPLPESDGGGYPFWSPDGQHLGFFAGGKLRRVDLRGGSPRDLADAPSGRGASWSRDGVILFAPNITSGIHRVSAEGGEATPLTPYDPEKETTQRWPHFLPDGRHFFFLSRVLGPDLSERGRLMLASLDDPEPQLLLDDSTNAVYVEPGHVIYGRRSDLVARPFDLSSLSFTGDAVPLLPEKVSYWEPKNLIVFTASGDGKLIYLPEATRQSVLQWYERGGRPLATLGEPDYYLHPNLSPDGSRIAVVRGKPQSGDQEIWILDVDGGREERLIFEKGDYESPLWSPDGSRLIYGCTPNSARDVCMKSASRGGEGEVIFESPNWNQIGSWTHDGKGVLFTEQFPETVRDVLRLDLDKPGEPTILIRTPFDEIYPQHSPDGRFIAYLSDESGRYEVYVCGADDSSQKWQISVEGGFPPRWSGDGDELFFVEPDGDLMAVAASVDAGGALRAGRPEKLFTLPEMPLNLMPLFADVSPDGQRLLLNLPTESRTSVGFHVVLDWPGLLER